MAITILNNDTIAGSQIWINTDCENSAQSLKASSATIFLIEIDNSANGAEIEFVKFWNSAGPTVGTTAPEMIIQIPGGAKRSMIFLDGLVFATGLEIAAVTTAGTAGTTSPTSSLIVKVVFV